MIHEETVEKLEVVQKVVRRWISCDMCNETIETSPFDIKEGEIRLRMGSSYPDGGEATELRADICEKCFMSKVVSWLEGQGVKIETKEENW